MADISKTINIIFGATDKTGPGIASVGKALGELDNSIQSVAQPFAALTGQILAIDTALFAMAATMTGVAVSAAGRFSSSVGEIGTLFNATEEQASQLSEAILDFSRSSTSSLDDINAATYIAISILQYF